MISIGLTGGIGSGKSTVAARLAELGAVVIDSDRLAREVVEVGSPGPGAGDRAVRCAGAGTGRQPEPAPARPAGLRQPGGLADLNAILHPLIRARSEALTAQALAAGVPAVVHDIPLLVENGMAAGFDKILVVEAPLELRLRRLAGGGWTPRPPEPGSRCRRRTSSGVQWPISCWTTQGRSLTSGPRWTPPGKRWWVQWDR